MKAEPNGLAIRRRRGGDCTMRRRIGEHGYSTLPSQKSQYTVRSAIPQPSSLPHTHCTHLRVQHHCEIIHHGNYPLASTLSPIVARAQASQPLLFGLDACLRPPHSRSRWAAVGRRWLGGCHLTFVGTSYDSVVATLYDVTISRWA